MSNQRDLHVVLDDLASEFDAELRQVVEDDLEGRGYSEGVREELRLRIDACRAGARAVRMSDYTESELVEQALKRAMKGRAAD